VIWFSPDRSRRETVATLRDAGVRLVGVRDGGLPSIPCRYEIRRENALRTILRRWRASSEEELMGRSWRATTTGVTFRKRTSSRPGCLRRMMRNRPLSPRSRPTSTRRSYGVRTTPPVSRWSRSMPLTSDRRAVNLARLAIVSGKDGTTGVGLVEIYHVLAVSSAGK